MGDALDILFVEDVDQKFDEVLSLVERTINIKSTHRARNLNEAEDAVMSLEPDLLVLDLSMDISATGSFDLSSGHATLGGLDILERMALMKISIPTVLVTGFDSFQDPDRFDNAIMNLSDVDGLAEGWIGSSYLGRVRYGAENWQTELEKILTQWRRT